MIDPRMCPDHSSLTHLSSLLGNASTRVILQCSFLSIFVLHVTGYCGHVVTSRLVTETYENGWLVMLSNSVVVNIAVVVFDNFVCAHAVLSFDFAANLFLEEKSEYISLL